MAARLQGTSAASWFGQLSSMGKVGVGLGACCVGGLCVAYVRHAGKVFMARSRLQRLLAEHAGNDARIVITGATNGIGAELAWQCLRNPAVSVLLGCRDVSRAERMFRRYLKVPDVEPAEANDAGAPLIKAEPRCRIVKLELLDLDSVQSFTDEVHAFIAGGDEGLRMLVNNAGVMKPPPKRSSAGADPTWQTNFFGPFLITELLARFRLKHISRKTPCRVVQVSSRLERRSQLDDSMLDEVVKGDGGPTAYGDSKRAMMLWTSVRAQSLAMKTGLFVHCTTPGMVDTQLGRNSVGPALWPWTKPLRMLLLRSAAEGALGVATAGLHKKATDTFGRYLDGEKQLEDLVMERMGEKRFGLQVTKWATVNTALEQRAEGYEK